MMAQFPKMQDYVIQDAGHMVGISKRDEYEQIFNEFLDQYT